MDDATFYPIVLISSLPLPNPHPLLHQDGPWRLRVNLTACKLCPQLPTQSGSKVTNRFRGAYTSCGVVHGTMDLKKRPIQALEAESGHVRQKFLGRGPTM